MRKDYEEVCHFDVPEGQVFWLERVGIDWEENADGDMYFCVCKDGTPIGPGFDDFQHQIGGLNFADMCVVQQRIVGPAYVSIEVRNPSVNDWDAYGRIFGFIGPNI